MNSVRVATAAKQRPELTAVPAMTYHRSKQHHIKQQLRQLTAASASATKENLAEIHC